MHAPVMKLALVDRGQSGIGAGEEEHPVDAGRSLAEIIGDPEIQAEYARLHENHLRNTDVIRKEGSCRCGEWLISNVKD
jgi:hypothetical protein